jgi:hypothetical protein
MSDALESFQCVPASRVRRRVTYSYCILGVIAVSCPCHFLAAAPLIDWLKVTPAQVPAGSATTALATAQLGVDATLLPQSVTLFKYNAAGRLLANLGRMYDDGTHGDTLQGDNIFSAQVTLNEPVPGPMIFKATVAYGAPLNKRITSDPATVMTQSTATAEQTIATLSSALIAGDKSTVLSYFDDSQVNRDSIVSMDSVRMNALAAMFSSAQLVQATETFHVYRSQWVIPGRSVAIEFTLGRNAEGKWVTIQVPPADLRQPRHRRIALEGHDEGLVGIDGLLV